MKGPWCATCSVGSINCDGNDCHPFKDSPRCWRITWTESSTTAAPKYASEWWKPSTATSKPYLEGAAATRISATCCSRPSAWQSPRPNSSCFRKQPKMRVSTNSCAEPEFLAQLRPFLKTLPKGYDFAVEIRNWQWPSAEFFGLLRERDRKSTRLNS